MNEENEQVTLEQEKQIQELSKNILKQSIKGHFAKIREYIDFHKLTIEQAIDEVNNKVSKLPKHSRDILIGVKIDILKEWFPKNPRIQYTE